MPANVIALFNRKGGVGKTSLCFHLAGHWAGQGRRVLCLDMDPQASLSQAFLGPACNSIPHEQTLASLFDGCETPKPETLIHGAGDLTGVPLPKQAPKWGVFGVCPAGNELGLYNLTDPQSRTALQSALAMFVNEWRPHYDFILIDCPPCVQLCTWASLLAADNVLVPVIPSDPGVQGLTHVRELVAQAQSKCNPRLRLLGYVLSMVQRNGLHRGYADLLRQSYPGQVLLTEVPRGTLFEQSITARVPVPLHRPKSAAAKVIGALAAEIDGRVALGRAA